MRLESGKEVFVCGLDLGEALEGAGGRGHGHVHVHGCGWLGWVVVVDSR